ncbi:MAG: hypothetical protein AB7K24_08770 [Gemmataceae bacterium]
MSRDRQVLCLNYRPNAIHVGAISDGSYQLRNIIEIIAHPQHCSIAAESNIVTILASNIVYQSYDYGWHFDRYELEYSSDVPVAGKAFRRGRVAFFADDKVWLRIPGEAWRIIVFRDVTLQDVSIDEDGVVYGISDTDIFSAKGQVVSAMGRVFSPKARRALQKNWGDGALRAINVEAKPIALMMECFTFVDGLLLADSPSRSIMAVQNDDVWEATLVNEAAFFFLRAKPGQVAAITKRGWCVSTESCGQSWCYEDFGEEIAHASGVRRVEIKRLASREGDLVAVVEVERCLNVICHKSSGSQWQRSSVPEQYGSLLDVALV